MKKLDYKWLALALLWVAFFLQQGTRQIYGPLLGSIQGAVGATDVQLGLVSTVFTLVYGLFPLCIFQLPPDVRFCQ